MRKIILKAVNGMDDDIPEKINLPIWAFLNWL